MTVITVHLDEDRDSCGSCREVGLLSMVLKFLERVLRDMTVNRSEAVRLVTVELPVFCTNVCIWPG